MMNTQTMTAGRGARLIRALKGWTLEAWQALLCWHAQQKAVRHLSELSDYHLRDIGLQRSEILLVVQGRTRPSQRP